MTGGDPVDDIERAIFDLQDVKNSYVNEQKEFEQKLSAAKTQEGFWQSKKPKENNFFSGQRPQTEGPINGQMMNTTSAGFKKLSIQGDLINDPEIGLHGEMEELTKEDLKERLIVAEKVMKSLFQRNRELEDKFSNENKTTTSTQEGKVEANGFSMKSEQQSQELAKENAQLKSRIEQLEKEMESLRSS